MPTPPISTASLPLVRDCRPGGLRPLLAPGGRDNYFVPDLQRLLFGNNEPIARFLPPAKWTNPERAERTQGGACPQVTYTVPDDILKTATPLTTLPRTEIEALADAVTVFLAKARPDAKGVPPYTRQCHQEFRLPNPELDPEAYWVYGPEFDRRLLILWGTEQQAGMSLPLDKAVEKLRQREMSWRDKQELALKLAMRPDEPLARFLAPRTQDGGLVVAGTPVSAKKVKRLKEITPKTWREFDAAAKAFYKKAHPDTADISPFEKELRAEFRLPGFQQLAGDYYSAGSSFVIAVDAWPREATLPLTEDPVLKLPETAGVTATAAIPAGATVAAQLAPITKNPIGRYIAMAAAAVVLLGVGLYFVFNPIDSSPTHLVPGSFKITSTRTVEFSFSRALDPASLKVVPKEVPHIRFVNDDLKIKGEPALSADGKRVTLTLDSELKDGKHYDLSFSDLVDAKKKPVKNDTIPIDYFDTSPLTYSYTNAVIRGNRKNQLNVFFSKPVRQDSLRQNSFLIVSDEPTPTTMRLKNDPVVDKTYPDGKVVLLETENDFGGGKNYLITITGVHDTSEIDHGRGNLLDEKSAEKKPFSYIDKLPPRLAQNPVADGGAYEVALVFTKAVDPKVATDMHNYKITAPPPGGELPLVPGGIRLEDDNKRVILQFAPTDLTSGNYKVRFEKMADPEGRSTDAAVEKDFRFPDANNGAGPAAKSATLEGRRLIVIFDRAPKQTSAQETSHYRVMDNPSSKFPVADVQKAVRLEKDKYELTLSQSLKPNEYTLEVTGVQDVYGSKSDQPSYAKFISRSVGVQPAPMQLINWVADHPATYKAGIVTLAIDQHIVESSAQNPMNYTFVPALTATVDGKPTFDKGKMTIRLKVANWPASGPVRVAVSGLLVLDAEQYGAQSLPPIEVVTLP